MGNAEIVGWRNAGNTADVTLTVNSSDIFVMNAALTVGGVIGASAGLVGAPSLSFSGDPDTGFYSVSANVLGFVSGGVQRFTLGTNLVAANSAIIRNSDGAVGTPSFTFDTDPDSGMYRIGANDYGFAANGVLQWRISATDLIGSLPVTITPTTNQIVLGTTRTVTLTAPTPASASRTITIPDLTGDYSVLGTIGNQTATGVKTFSGQLIGKGTATNDSAAAGFIGEYVVASVVGGSAVTATNNTLGDVTNISLTAGDWDVTGLVIYQGTVTGTEFIGGIGTASGTTSTGLVSGDTQLETPTAPTAASDSAVPTISAVRMSLSGTSTIYLKYKALFTVGTCKVYGRISARRVR